MYILNKERVDKLASILNSDYYNKWVKYFTGVLRTTRDKRCRNNPKVLLAIQLKLAQVETQLLILLRRGREKAKELHSLPNLNDKQEKDLKGYEKHIMIHEHLIRISKTICDGIAWRNLGYNRMFLNSSARGFGYHIIDVNNPSFKSEFKWACIISNELKSLVLLNDLTRFLRVGDLTEINPKGVFLHEIKQYGKRVKNLFTLKQDRSNKLSYQDRRLLELQRISLLNEIKIEDLLTKQKKINVNLKTYTYRIKKLIRRSEKEYIVYEQINPCITVEITNFQAVSKSKNVDLELLKSKSYKPNRDSKYLVHSNWDSFYSDSQGNFLRALPPYSIFPLSSYDCTRLMSGHYLVKTFFNIDQLKEYLQNQGWEIEEFTEGELDHYLEQIEREKANMFAVSKLLYESAKPDIGLFKISKGPFSANINFMLYSRLTMEYITLKSFSKILKEMYKQASIIKRPEAYFPVFANEKEIWN